MTTIYPPGRLNIPRARVMREDEKARLEGFDAMIYGKTTRTVYIVECDKYLGIGFTVQDAEDEYVKWMAMTWPFGNKHHDMM